MNSLRSLLITFMICGHVAAAEDPWLKPPDGFVWPDAAIAKLGDDTQLSLSSLPQEIRDYLADQYAPQSPPAAIYVRRVDLNGDGVPEWFVNRPELGGTGGGAYDILDLSNKKARYIGGLLGGFELCVPAPREKWLRIECSSRAGGGHFTRYLLQYKMGTYQEVRNEDHDLINNKVTVRK